MHRVGKRCLPAKAETSPQAIQLTQNSFILMKTLMTLLAVAAVAASSTFAGEACKKCCKDNCAACCKDKGKTCGKDCCKGEK